MPHPNDDSYDPSKMPLLTGVSAGSMIAAATLAGVNTETDGMEVVLEAARRTRELSSSRQKQNPQHDQDREESGLLENLGISLDVLTPGFSLIDQVEGPFRNSLAKALGGYCVKDHSKNNYTFHDIDPDLFARRFPHGALRIGLTDRRELRPPSLFKAYRYVDSYRDLEDVIACSMLSSYVPLGTGPLKLKDKMPNFLGGLMPKSEITDVSDRSGIHLKEMEKLGMVKNGITGLPTVNDTSRGTEDVESKDESNTTNEPTTNYWDGGLTDMFPTFDNDTVIVSPLNGVYDPNPSICPQIPDIEYGAKKDSASTSAVQNYLSSYLPSTFRHCQKSQLGLNSKNANMALLMAFSSDNDELYLRFRDGYDDTRRFLDKRGQLEVFSG